MSELATYIEVIFSGLALFCLNEGQFCHGKPDTVYLLNGKDDAKVCGRELDGGHEPVISFDGKHLLPGSAHPHRIVRTGLKAETVFANLDGIDLCVCVEDAETGGCRKPETNEAGAKPLMENVKPGQQDPQMLQDDAEGFQWIPKLADMYTPQPPNGLCPGVDAPLDQNKLVAARVRLDQGTVLTDPGWYDSWGWFLPRWVRFLTEKNYLIWEARSPVEIPSKEGSSSIQNHFPKALPGHVMWRIPVSDERIPAAFVNEVVLINDCSDRAAQKTLFRLALRGDDLRIYINNAPHSKHPLAAGVPLDHFWWYYRIVDWGMENGCNMQNQKKKHCPSGLTVPYLPDRGENAKPKLLVKGVLTVGDKCPPASTG